MDVLGDLLKRIQIPGLKESADRHLIAGVLTSTTGVTVSARQITFKDNILTLSVPPVLKSAVHIHKQEIQNQLKEKGISIKEIR